MQAFPPPELFKVAQAAVAQVKAGILGRIADERDNTSLMVTAALLAGAGDHLEIGTLFGGSAIAVLLAKKELGLAGKVVCVDPLDGYYMGTRWESVLDPVCNQEVSPKVVMENASRFGVQDLIQIIQKGSCPWPDELVRLRFSSAYIDGDHWGQAPLRDWSNVSACTDGYVVFDNYDALHPDVLVACNLAAMSPRWDQVYRGGITCVFQKENGK